MKSSVAGCTTCCLAEAGSPVVGMSVDVSGTANEFDVDEEGAGLGDRTEGTTRPRLASLKCGVRFV